MERPNQIISKEAKVFLSIAVGVSVLMVGGVFVFSIIPDGYFDDVEPVTGGDLAFVSLLGFDGALEFKKIESAHLDAADQESEGGMVSQLTISDNVVVQKRITVNIVESLSPGGAF